MVTPSVIITETENGFKVTDNTDYSSEQIIGSYTLYDYTSTIPATNSEFETTLISAGGTVIFNDFVSIHTDGLGNIHNAEEVYNHIVETVNEGSFDVKARLNKDNSTSFRAWKVEFYTFDQNLENAIVNVTSTLTPNITTDLTGTNTITFRNLSIINPKESYEDVGGIAQVDTIKFNYPKYTIGETITLSFCEQNIIYDVTTEDVECIIPEIVNLINAGVDGDKWYTLEAKMVGNDELVITQTNIGVPFSVSIAYSDNLSIDPFTLENTTPNTPSMTVPTLTSIDSYEFIETDRGGKYIVSLSIGSVCDYNTTTIEYYSWVFDKEQLDCCFNAKLIKDTCCAKTTEQIINTSALRNVIYGISVAERESFDPTDIQKLINLGYDMCDGCGCNGGCGGC